MSTLIIILIVASSCISGIGSYIASSRCTSIEGCGCKIIRKLKEDDSAAGERSHQEPSTSVVRILEQVK